MMRLSKRFVFLLPVLLACATRLQAADESLSDKSKARPLTPTERPAFGPQSGGLQYDPRMIRAMEIAKKRAQPKMTWKCWKYVKNALVASGTVTSRPTSMWANQAGQELCSKYGFVQLKRVHDPYHAPIGAVVVYDGADGGHVEMRTPEGFVSDFFSTTAYPRPLVGVFVKPTSS